MKLSNRKVNGLVAETSRTPSCFPPESGFVFERYCHKNYLLGAADLSVLCLQDMKQLFI